MSKPKIKRPRDANRLAHAIVQESIQRFEQREKGIDPDPQQEPSPLVKLAKRKKKK
ncbi:MAG: hypothetical protein OXI58_11265 [Gemmatimonadota bacterium]|nr:hypothetical protein [Gemmatimonadota bacterium]